MFGRDADGVAWRPDPASARESRLARFIRATGEPSLAAMHAHAVADPGWFWGAAVDDIGVAWTKPPRQVLDLDGGPAWARWWIGGSFDWSRAATEPRTTRDPGGTAVTWEGEDGTVRTRTNAQLAGAVRSAVKQLASMGVVEGDRVGILMPMLPVMRHVQSAGAPLHVMVFSAADLDGVVGGLDAQGLAVAYQPPAQ